MLSPWTQIPSIARESRLSVYRGSIACVDCLDSVRGRDSIDNNNMGSNVRINVNGNRC